MALQFNKKDPLWQAVTTFGKPPVMAPPPAPVPAQRQSALDQVQSVIGRPVTQAPSNFGQAPSNYTNPFSAAVGSLFQGTQNALKSTDAFTGLYDLKSRSIDNFLQANMGKPGANEVAQQMRQKLLNDYQFAGNDTPQGVDYNLSPQENAAKAAGTALQTVSEVYPFRAGQMFLKGNGLGANVLRAAGTGGLVSGVGSAGAQLAQTGQIDPLETAKSAATGTLISGAIPVLGAIFRRAMTPRIQPSTIVGPAQITSPLPRQSIVRTSPLPSALARRPENFDQAQFQRSRGVYQPMGKKPIVPAQEAYRAVMSATRATQPTQVTPAYVRAGRMTSADTTDAAMARALVGTNPVTENSYLRRINELSKSYDREIKAAEKLPPLRRQPVSDEINSRYERMIASLEQDRRLTKALSQSPLPMESTQARKPKITLSQQKISPSLPTRPTIPEKPKVALKQPPAESPIPQVNLRTSINPNDPFGNSTPGGQIRNELGKVSDQDAEMINFLRKVEKQTGRTGLVDQWMFDTGNIRSSNAKANAKIRYSPELRGALHGLSKKELNQFDQYAAARAELKNYNGLKTSRAPQESQAVVNQLEGKYGQRFESLNQYYKQQARDLHAGGLIDGATLKKYLASDNYVRIQRDMQDLLNPQFGGSNSRSIGTTTATQKRTGSERGIIAPTKTVVKRTQQLELEIARNKAATNTIDLLNELGLSRRVSDTKNKNTISRLVNGKREVYEVPKDIKRVVDNVNPYQLGIIAHIVSTPARLFRAGTTALSAPFTATNYLRDQGSSLITSKAAWATHNPVNIVSGLASAMKDFVGESRSPLWQKFEQYVGNTTIADELRNVKNTDSLLREVRRGPAGKLGNAVGSPIRTLEDLNSITEKATRFQNFKGIYQKTLKETGDENAAIRAAVLAARQNSVDFMRSSPFTRVMNLLIPYFNASVQGSRTVARAFKERPVATSMKAIGFVALPSIAATMYNYSDPERRKIYESINQFEKGDNYIIVGPDAKQREDGSWEGVIKIPKPQGYRELVDPVRKLTESFVSGQAPQDVAGMLKDMLGGLTGPVNIEDGGKFVGSFVPQAAKPWLQLAMNKDLYTGNDIVPAYMNEQTDNPTQRAYKNTSGTARLIANQLGVSPIQVEKAVKDVAGSLGLYSINASDTALASAGVIPADQIGGRSIANDFSRRMFEATASQLESNKSDGQKYYEDVKKATAGLNQNEMAAFNSLHPTKTNFLGEDIFNENKRITAYTRAGAYLNNPGTLEADRKLNQLQRDRGKPSNPLFDLPKPELTKVLLKATLPPGANDPELSNLYKQPWYQDYQNARSRYYDQVKASLEAEGKKLPESQNPYPSTPVPLQKAMDAYSALPKGTGARSSWIKANPGLWQQMTDQWAQVDAWDNKERVAIGLAPVQQQDTSSFGGGKGGGKSNPTADAYKYAVSLSAGGKAAKPKVTVKKASGSKLTVKKQSAAKPKVTIKRSSV